ncbi:MAG TPA: hypothetical protein VLE54_04565, partial [Thermoanaerobaculia bacterium]|nr:hypothetical protein [Thermoanaerobaculia bacterium]
ERPAPRRVPWPEVRGRLDSTPPNRGRRALGWALAVVLIFAASETFRRGIDSSREKPDFRVTEVSRNGRPANALVVQPDRNTLVVVVQ